MRRWMAVVFALCMGVALLVPDASAARKERGDRGKGREPEVARTVVVVQPGHPIRHRMHTVIVHRPDVVVRVTPVNFLPMTMWRPVAVLDRPMGDHLVWQDGQTLDRDEDWTQTVFDSNQRGAKLYLEVVSGRVQFDFAEVVFENGDCRVVDFNNGVRRPGLYTLLDFPDGRRVDHVRLIARAKTEQAHVALLMAK